METIDHTTGNPVENVLSGFYKNAAVGADGISALLPEVQDMRLRKELFAQRTYYRDQMQNIRRQMAEIWLEPLESGRTARYWTKLMIRMKVKLGMTVETAAKLMVEGTNMGMVQLRQLLNHNPNIPTDLKTQGEKILSHEQEYLARITPYL